MMKLSILRSVILLAFVALANTGYSQNSLELNWGNSVPLNSKLNDAFGRSQLFSVGFFHPLENPRFELGLKWNHEHYSGEPDFFSGGYSANFKLHYISAAGRYYFLKNSNVNVFAGIGAGFHHLNLKETKNGNASVARKNGFSSGIDAGIDLSLSKRIRIGAGLQFHTHFTDQLNFNCQLPVNQINSVGGSLGIKFFLNKNCSD